MNDPSPIGAWILERHGQPRWDHLQHHMLKPYARPVKHVQHIQVTQQKVALWVLWWNELSICYWCWIWIKVYDHKLQSMWSFFLYTWGSATENCWIGCPSKCSLPQHVSYVLNYWPEVSYLGGICHKRIKEQKNYIFISIRTWNCFFFSLFF